MRTRLLLLAILSFVYWAVRRLLELLVLCARGEGAKEVELGRRRVHLAGVIANPNSAWVEPQARN
jgi:hypothetical protein